VIADQGLAGERRADQCRNGGRDGKEELELAQRPGDAAGHGCGIATEQERPEGAERRGASTSAAVGI